MSENKFKESPLLDLVTEIEKHGLTMKFREDLNSLSLVQLVELKSMCSKQYFEFHWAEYEVKWELKKRRESLKEEIAKAKYDRENSELSYNDTTLWIN